jgi:energy-coupling factor transporter ATP-binding protein EcfA2
MSNVYLLKVKNVMAVEQAEIKLGRVTIISGQNGAGKTSIMRALRTLAEGGNAPKIIRNGADQAEISLETDTMTINKTITADNNKVSLMSGDIKLSSSPTDIKNLFGRSFNPIGFLGLDDAKRIDEVMARMPIKITKEELQALTGLNEIPVDFNLHGLKVLDMVRDMVYKTRTAANTSAKTLKTQTEGMSSAVVETDITQQEFEDIGEKIRLAELEKEKLTRDVIEVNQKYDNECDQAIEELRKEFDTRCEAIRETCKQSVTSKPKEKILLKP